MNDNGRAESQIVAASVESGKAMGSATKDGDKDGGMDELFKLNQVWYRMPPTLSLVSKRTITRCQFQQNEYNASLQQQIATLIFNSGEFYISPKTSFLVIQAGIDKAKLSTTTFPGGPLQLSTMHAWLGQGGISNIFEEITFTSASGTEIDRHQNKGLQASHINRNMMSQTWYDSQGQLQGYPGGTFQDCYDTYGWPGHWSTTAAAVSGPWLVPSRTTTDIDYSVVELSRQTGTTGSHTTTTLDVNQRLGPTGSVDVSFTSGTGYDATYQPVIGVAPTFIVPLSDVLGCYNPYMNALFPAAALAGGRLEFRFKSMTEALIATGAGLTSAANASAFLDAFKIYNIYLDLDSYQMNDSVLKRLNQVAAGNEGLTVMFDTVDWAPTQVSALSFEAQVSQARSRISRSFCVIRDIATRTNPFANSLASEAAVNRNIGYSMASQLDTTAHGQQQLVNTYQAVLGSLYFPNQPLTQLAEYVMNSYYTFCRDYCNPEEVSAVTLSEFMGANGTGQYDPTTHVVIVPGTGTGPTDILRGTTAGGFFPLTLAVPTWTLNWGSATYGFLAERSQLLQLTGLPISNARLLRHQFTVNYNPAGGQGRIVDVFTVFTRVMKVFLGGRVVMRE